MLAAMLGACAWVPGTGFATVREVGLELALDAPKGRFDDQRRWKTNQGNRLILAAEGLRLSPGALTLLSEAAAAGPATGGAFDPTRPPPGFSNCHGGHCHRDDGALVDYADIEAQLAGGGVAAARPLLRLPPSAAALALGGEGRASLRLTACEPHCHLPRGRVGAVSLDVLRLQASGQVVSPDGEQRQAWTLDLPLTGFSWRQALSTPLEVGLSGPLSYALQGSWRLPEDLFDDLPWERVWQASGSVALEADQAFKQPLLEHVRKAEFRITVRALD
ncbi:MAG: hypothetical protein VKP62_09840 [Candidatus Sericytochromatia bacterium]|nr:hypothetical protein [Candidatus Sericytochromatia bacterium]